MEPRKDPYTPGSGIKSLKLAGRDNDLDAFGILLERVGSGMPERSLVEAPGGFQAKLDIDATTGSADSGDAERDLAALLVAIGEVAEAGGRSSSWTRCKGSRRGRWRRSAWRSTRSARRGLPVALVGAGLPPLPRLRRSPTPNVSSHTETSGGCRRQRRDPRCAITPSGPPRYIESVWRLVREEPRIHRAGDTHG